MPTLRRYTRYLRLTSEAGTAGASVANPSSAVPACAAAAETLLNQRGVL